MYLNLVGRRCYFYVLVVVVDVLLIVVMIELVESVHLLMIL